MKWRASDKLLTKINRENVKKTESSKIDPCDDKNQD